MEHFKRKQVEAVLILCADFNNDDIVELYDSNIPSIVIDFNNIYALNITSSNKDGVRSAVALLKELGHKHIGHISGGEDSYIALERNEFFLQAMKENDLVVNNDFIITGHDFIKENGYAAMQKIMKLDNQPTAVFCSSDLLAIGAIQAIKESGKSVPEDYSVIGFDGTELGQMFTPRLTTIKQDADRIGEIAAQNILSMIEQQKKISKGQTIYVDCNLIVGDSTKVLS